LTCCFGRCCLIGGSYKGHDESFHCVDKLTDGSAFVVYYIVDISDIYLAQEIGNIVSTYMFYFGSPIQGFRHVGSVHFWVGGRSSEFLTRSTLKHSAVPCLGRCSWVIKTWKSIFFHPSYDDDCRIFTRNHAIRRATHSRCLREPGTSTAQASACSTAVPGNPAQSPPRSLKNGEVMCIGDPLDTQYVTRGSRAGARGRGGGGGAALGFCSRGFFGRMASLRLPIPAVLPP